MYSISGGSRRDIGGEDSQGGVEFPRMTYNFVSDVSAKLTVQVLTKFCDALFVGTG